MLIPEGVKSPNLKRPMLVCVPGGSWEAKARPRRNPGTAKIY